MHRNTYINSPAVLDEHLAIKNKNNVIVAGQLSGVEGYVESAATGIIAGIIANRLLAAKKPILPPTSTIVGSLIRYVTKANPLDFSPMNANFGILENANKRHRENDIARSLVDIEKYWKEANE